jgi:hypothetical protein
VTEGVSDITRIKEAKVKPKKTKNAVTGEERECRL